jgi:CRISPR/Cas system-associated endonuclease Cas1
MISSGVLTVEGYDARLYVERGHLVVKDGFTAEDRREIHFPRGRCAVERIVIRAQGGTVSIEAISWCASMGIAISLVASDSTLLNCLVPDVPHDGPVKRAQAVSAVTDDAPVLARYMLTKKMDSQIAAIERDFGRLKIGSDPSRKAAVAQIRSCIESLNQAQTLVDFLTMEGRAAQIY